MERALKWLEIPIHAALWIALVSGFLMMMHVSADVTGRTVFNNPVEGTTEFVSVYYMVAVVYLPWAWLARNDGHIKVGVFTSFASPRFVERLEIVVKGFTILFLAVFVWRATLRAFEQTQALEVWQAGTKYLAIWPSRWVLPFAGGLMALYLLLRVAADVAAALRR